MKPKLLDLFCGAGGASMGYYRAGFEVVDVDIKTQPHYCGDSFILIDAIDALEILNASCMLCDESGRWWDLSDIDAIHASPPCQAYTIARNNKQVKNAPDLIEPIRQLLLATEKPYIIENVYGSPLISPAMLCGASFGLGVGGFDLCRHRYFETNFALMTMPCQHRRGFTIGVYGNGTNKWHREKFGRCVTVDEFRQAMGIDWMIRKELSQAIPPAYTEYIGKYLLQVINGQ